VTDDADSAHPSSARRHTLCNPSGGRNSLKARRESSAPTWAVTVRFSDSRSTSRTKRPSPRCLRAPRCHKSVADNHVRLAREDVAALNVADEADGQRLEQRKASRVRSLPCFLLRDGEQARRESI